MVIWFLYAFVAIGAVLLAFDLRTRIESRPARPQWMAWIGLVAGAVAGLAPLAIGLTGGIPVAWTFVAIALVELVAFLAFAGGVVGFFGDEKSPRLRRVGYACLLVLVSIPSSLLLLAPFVAIAGISLVAPLATPVGRDTPS